jgi:hypothetical protein
MNYLYGYLALGAVLIAINYYLSQSTTSREIDIYDGLLFWAGDPRRNKWWVKLLNNVALLIVGAMFLAVWPIAICWKVIEARRFRNEESFKEFAVTKEHLQRRRTVSEIEAAEVVMDPMGAVPRSPFGHLNPAWEVFRKSILEDDELWAFSAPWMTKFGRNELREGYVVVREETIGPSFLTRSVLIDEYSN